MGNGGKEIPVQLIDFWRWSASDIGLAHNVRSEWESYDLKTQKGKRIEVKSASYLQSWFQKELSKISFSIRPSRKWSRVLNCKYILARYLFTAA